MDPLATPLPECRPRAMPHGGPARCEDGPERMAVLLLSAAMAGLLLPLLRVEMAGPLVMLSGWLASGAWQILRVGSPFRDDGLLQRFDHGLLSAAGMSIVLGLVCLARDLHLGSGILLNLMTVPPSVALGWMVRGILCDGREAGTRSI